MSPQNSVSRPSTATQVLLAVFRAAADMLRTLFTPGWIGSPEYRAQVEDDDRREKTFDDALRLRYPVAEYCAVELERRAREHRVRSLGDMLPHHVAAFSDYFADPGSITVSPIQALNIQAYDLDGKYNGSKTHPVNPAQYRILAQFARSIGWDDEEFSPARLAWTDRQWIAHERAERERRRRARELTRSMGRPFTLEKTYLRNGLPHTIRYDI